MKILIPKFTSTFVLFVFFLFSVGELAAQRSNFIFLDTVEMTFKPVVESCLKVKTVYIEPGTQEDSIYRSLLVSKLDPRTYTVVSDRSSADLILVYSIIFGSRSNTTDGVNLKTASLSAPAGRYIPTSGETNADHNFDSRKNAQLNSKSKYNRKTPASPKSYSYSGATDILTKIVLYDSLGGIIDEVVVSEKLILTGHSSISSDVAKKDYTNLLEKEKPAVKRFHLETAMNNLAVKFLFNTRQIPVYAVKMNEKNFGDWNDAVNALNSWVNTPGRRLDDSRLAVMEKIFKEQVVRDYSSMKDKAFFVSAAQYNLAVFEYYSGKPVEAAALLTRAQGNMVYKDDSQRLFYENLVLSLAHGIYTGSN